MKQFPKVVLKSGRERSLQRYHLWVFSGAIKSITGKPEEGDVVEVYSANDEYLATGHIQNGSIMVRLFSFEQTDAGREFWRSGFERAFAMRKNLGFFDDPQTNTFRLIHGEGDRFPGLIMDYYNGVVVLQAHSVGMWRHREMFASIVSELLEDRVHAVYDKSESTLNEAEAVNTSNFLVGESGNAVVSEYGHTFEVDFREGQKTGFFIDQRESRRLVSQCAKGRKVANVFSYTGGFSVYAAAGGAVLVDSVDASDKAIALARKNMQLNFGENPAHRFFAMDAFGFFKQSTESYDLIVLDPPAFAKHQAALSNALKAYRRINEAAFRRLTRGGLLFTYSCSQVVSKEDFRKAVFSAAAATGRSARILFQLDQPPDHPVNIYHPEGEYLKGLVVYVE